MDDDDDESDSDSDSDSEEGKEESLSSSEEDDDEEEEAPCRLVFLRRSSLRRLRRPSLLSSFLLLDLSSRVGRGAGTEEAHRSTPPA